MVGMGTVEVTMRNVFFGRGCEHESTRTLVIAAVQAVASVIALLGVFPALRLILWILDIRE